jgi:Domain of unknown function (DUF4136)
MVNLLRKNHHEQISFNIKIDFMEKISIAGMFVCAAAIIYSCSSPAYVEKDSSANLSNYKTYMWVDVKAGENDASSRATAFADVSVHNSVNAELSKWGWQEVTDKPDVLVSYDVLVERNVESQSDPVYSQPYSRFYYNPYTRRWSTIYLSLAVFGISTIPGSCQGSNNYYFNDGCWYRQKDMAGVDDRKIEWRP